ncbi:SLC13 family permease [Pelistega suis]|uniref:SLC13 family permease n=1 Tax=Pelistega suis TaxID=1631957 RepID=A0A849PC36_9BURK|nr:SLC13 family permease [Pelistega suis]NOL52447.1 SLC13 family permease [Pelistega suis]
MISIILLSILLVIAVGYITKINIGFFAIAAAYLIGAFMMDLSINDLIKQWPVKIFFVIFSLSLFYNIALANGALEKLANHLLYHCRNIPNALPLALFAAATIIAGLGAGFYTVLAFMAPLTLLLCTKTKMNLVIGSMALNYGALAGANFMTSQSGIIFRGLLETNHIPQTTAFSYSSGIFIATLLLPIVLLSIYSLWSFQSSSIEIQAEKPEPFTQQQKQSIYLILLLMGIVLIIPILKIIFPDNLTISWINKKLDIGFLAIIFAAISFWMKLADEKKVIALVPWNTLIMICGMGMLIGVGVQAGVINTLATWISGNVPVWLIPIAFCVISAIMSIFSSTLGVVAPTLFPIVPSIAAQADINPLILFIAIVVGAQATSISPFSSGGSLILSSAPADVDKNVLLNKLLFQAIPIGVIAALIAIIATQLIL